VSQVTPAAPAPVGFFGKIPAERDFVRVNAGGFLQAGLDRWFQEGVEHLQRAPLPEACFLLSPAAGAQPFVGVLAPNQDAIGRAFPAVIFAALDPQLAREEFSLLPLRFASFFEASARLATAAHALAAAQLTAEIDTLASGFRPAVRTPDIDALLVRSSCSDLRAAVGGPAEAAAYALTTVVAACAQTKAQPPESPGRALTLDCPAPTDELRTFWLELVRRNLGAEVQMPSLLWTRESGRLLVALGPAPGLLLACLADPEHRGSRLWPLYTHDPRARANAMERLSPAQRQALAAGDASLADVLQSF
jgi:type VI secretion-associated protein, BMA_A0400 family